VRTIITFLTQVVPTPVVGQTFVTVITAVPDAPIAGREA
jgi:hypothetical protein